MSAPGSIPFVRAVGTARLACDFFTAAGAQDQDGSPPSFVAYFLYGHALELAFKSLLILHGTTNAALRDIGHDLARARDAAVREAPSGTIPMGALDTARIDLLAAYYEAKALEYVQPGPVSLPLLRELRDTAERLTSAILVYVDSAVRARLSEDRAV